MILYSESSNNFIEIVLMTDELEKTKSIKSRISSSQTDEFIQKIDELICDQDSSLKGIFIKPDPDSYTSVRIALTIANFLGFSLNIQPVVVSSIKQIDLGAIKKFDHSILPDYKSEPIITRKKR
jgi:tRNA A37 threonylcarbamoyladenosine modification protein TsaB